jgi:hypothetical protein
VTSTTTTSTTTSPDQTSDEPTATFNGPDFKLYKPKGKTFVDVLNGFRTRVVAMPWYTTLTGFFNITVGGGACPHWVVPASKFTPALDASPYFCSSTMMTIYGFAGTVVLILAGVMAFKIGVL